MRASILLQEASLVDLHSFFAASRRRVLISGASIAGPTLAYWLDRFGFDVTVVERAPAVRRGGYAIDIRGSALGVVERMGLRAQIDAAHIASRGLTFVDGNGEKMGTVPIYDLTSNDLGRDVELPRGTLTDMLYNLTVTARCATASRTRSRS